MGMRSLFTGMFIITSMYLIFVHEFRNVSAAPGNSNSIETHRTRSRPIAGRLTPRFGPQYSRMKPDGFNDFIDDDDLFELSKRQTSDDYGHLRFGKRGEDPFDDYGHMRFGRGGSEK